MAQRQSQPDPGDYTEKVRELAQAAPKLSTEQQRKLVTTFGGGPR